MNKPITSADLVTPKVTTGPIAGSRKTYATPEAAPDLRVPIREIMLDASSGEQNRHRLSRAGNRRMNRMLHIAATTQIRLDTEGRAYYRRKLADGKTRMEAMRCLKRRISDAVYRQLVADAHAAGNAEVGTGPGGHCGATQESSAVDLPPHIDTSDQPLPGPAKPTLQPSSRHRKPVSAQALPSAS